MLSREQAEEDGVVSKPSPVRSQLLLVGCWTTPELSFTPLLVGRGSSGGCCSVASCLQGALGALGRIRTGDQDFCVTS